MNGVVEKGERGERPMISEFNVSWKLLIMFHGFSANGRTDESHFHVLRLEFQ